MKMRLFVILTRAAICFAVSATLGYMLVLAIEKFTVPKKHIPKTPPDIETADEEAIEDQETVDSQDDSNEQDV